MKRLLFSTAVAIACSCAPSPTLDEPGRAAAVPAEPAQAAHPACSRPLPAEPPMAGFNAAAVREIVRGHVRARFGAAALADMDAAPAALMATFHQGLPRPIQCPDGSWTYEGPSVGAARRLDSGWIAWRHGGWRELPAATSGEIDRLLADPALWREPDYDPPSCTDVGAQRLVIRHGGRETVRQQGCGGSGLTDRLSELVLGGA